MLQGAASILRLLADPGAEVSRSDALDRLKSGLKELEENGATLAPDLAAARWLELFDAYVLLPAESLYRDSDYQSRPSVQRFFGALPSPDAWPAIQAGLRVRADASPGLRGEALKLLAALLDSDAGQRVVVLEAARRAIAAEPRLATYEKRMFDQVLRNLDEAFALDSSDEARVATFARVLREREKQAPDERDSFLQVPDLVRMAGEEAAVPLLVQVLRMAPEHTYIQGEGTRALAARLALGNVDSLPRPLWSLVRSTEDLALFDAMAAKFPDSSGTEERRAAEAVRLLGLIVTGKTEEAVSLALEPGRFQADYGLVLGHAFAEMQRKGHGQGVHDFLSDLLKQHPAAPFWPDFIDLSAQLGRSGAALTLLSGVLDKSELPAEQRRVLEGYRVAALLAADELEPAIALMRHLVRVAEAAKDDAPAAAQTSAPSSGVSSGLMAAIEAGAELSPELLEALQTSSPTGRSVDARSVALDHAIRLAQIGHLTGRSELLAEGIESALSLLARGEPEQDSFRVLQLEAVLLDAGRFPEAERLAKDELLRAHSAESRPGSHDTVAALLRLLEIYHRAGRHADVLALLEESELWGAEDISKLAQAHHRDSDLHFIAAAALEAVGRGAEARPILRKAIQLRPGSDASYELLAKIGQEDHERFLDEVARIDRFEERPLIWKAQAQLQSGRLAEAETTIRAAIAIDPSDGEQGKGDRMRAYAVLGDILARRGDAEQAALMRSAVAAIRLSETADDWWSAGLLTRAVGIYEASLTKFADAYCIQSRLALRYNELGDFAKAEFHYQRAFELMPDSFGRVESHCFGCEGAFNGLRAQGVAERVFGALAEKMPENPRVAYLLAYLRESQERFPEAADLLKKAVALDPDYLNAWSKLQDIASQTALPRATRQAAALAILRLDPTGRRSRPETRELGDLRSLWLAIREAEAALPPRDEGTVFPLSASARRLAAMPGDERDELRQMQGSWREDPRLRLRALLREHQTVNASAQLVEQVLRR